jgi:transcriptional regulator with XRE-family HTH domain
MTVVAQALAEKIARVHGSTEAVRIMRKDVGLTEADVATATGADKRSVRRWLQDTRPVRHERQIDDLRSIVQVLAETLTPDGIRQWLRARNRYLKGDRPLDALARGEYDRVQEAAEAFVEGYFV